TLALPFYVYLIVTLTTQRISRCDRPASRSSHCTTKSFQVVRATMSALGQRADVRIAIGHVRFTPTSGHVRRNQACLIWAKSGLMHRSKKDPYSITSSARARRDVDTVRPSAIAVLRLTTSSYFVGC